MNGGKVMSMDVPELKMKFVDSLNYNQQSLASWPKTFGLEDVNKGTFPHAFNRPENWDRTVPYPGKSEFGYERMKGKDRVEFDAWYAEDSVAKGGLYEFRKEFVDYCRQDVTVLRKCCLLFRELFMEISGGMCPFVTAKTIAGLCHEFWRALILEEDQIGRLPINGYNRNRHQSVKALKWLNWVEQETGHSLQHRDSGGEAKVAGRFVDGFHEETDHVYEFHGCMFHGCLQCFKPDTVHPFRDMPMQDINAETLQADQELKDAGYHVTTMWEHEYDSRLKTDPEFAEFCRTVRVMEPLNPRSAFYGGRTNAVKLHHKISGHEEIRYYDVCR
jgi:G:T-mismatch repair DNA endonuclease (very short patch repair protein)